MELQDAKIWTTKFFYVYMRTMKFAMAATITTYFQPVAALLLLIQWTQEPGKKKPKHWLGRPWKVAAVNDGNDSC